MSYQDLLNTKEWKSKRNKILTRDKFQCQECLNSSFDKIYDPGFYITKIGRTNFSICGFDSSNRDMSVRFFNYNLYQLPNENCKVYLEKGTHNLVAVRNLIESEIRTYGESNEYNRQLMLAMLVNNRPINHIMNRNTHLSNFDQKVLMDFSWHYVVGLHVHHKHYQIGLNPWEYSDEFLKTLCWQCHENLHLNKVVPVLDENGFEIKKYHPCQRCHGAGWFPQYNHVEGGICFNCQGVRYEELMGLR